MLACKAPFPTAVLQQPVVVTSKALSPTPVFPDAVVFVFKLSFPTATLLAPDVLAVKAQEPTAVLD